ncbi:hypothetical protein [Sinomicrobium sp. M5D2P17]
MMRTLLNGIKAFALLGLLSACSNDDDEGFKMSESPIIGKWQFIDEFAVLEDQPPLSPIIEMCELELRMRFSEEGIYTYERFDLDYETVECLSEGEKEGTWEIVSDSIYRFYADEKDGGRGPLNGSFKIWFTENNSQLIIESREPDWGFEYPVTVRKVYEKE